MANGWGFMVPRSGFLGDVTGIYGAVGLQFMGPVFCFMELWVWSFMEPNFEDYVTNDLEMMAGILSFSRAKGSG